MTGDREPPLLPGRRGCLAYAIGAALVAGLAALGWRRKARGRSTVPGADGPPFARSA